MKSIFLSYANEDRAAALSIHQFLEKNGLPAWIDVHDLLPGQEWEFEIDSAIRTSKVFIACMSTKSVSKRGFVQSELRKALKVLETTPEGQIYLIPVRLDDCDVPRKLEHLHWVDYFTSDGPARLVSAIHLQLNVEDKSTSQGLLRREVSFGNIVVDGSNPYWEEIEKPSFGYPFNRECKQYFRIGEFVYGNEASPSFDITLINLSENPVLLTAVGVEIVCIAQICYVGGDIPEAAKVFKGDIYNIEMPDLHTRLFGRRRLKDGNEAPGYTKNLSQRDVNELVTLTIPDPIYFESKAPYRYGLFFDKYDQRMPNNTIARLWAKTSEGETKSDEIYLRSR